MNTVDEHRRGEKGERDMFWKKLVNNNKKIHENEGYPKNQPKNNLKNTYKTSLDI